MTASLTLRTAGVTVWVDDRTGRHGSALARAAGVGPSPGGAARPDADEPDVRVVVERGSRRFDTTGLRPVTRGAWAGTDSVVLESVGGSGFDQQWRIIDGRVEVRARWAPGPLERAARRARSRFDALRAQVLLHYPALWVAGLRGLAPLHVSVLEVDRTVVLLAGPGGVGKSTLVADALATGARAACDNVAVSDGTLTHGLREPLRLDPDGSRSGAGQRTTHGRREHLWTGHVDTLRPDLVVVVRRGGTPSLQPVDARTAQQSLVAGTYAAGELKRFWPLTATLALATGAGPAHPEVSGAADRLTGGCRCLALDLGNRRGVPLRTLLAGALDDTASRGASA